MKDARMTGYITIQDAAKFVKRSVQTLYRDIKRGTLEGKRINGRIYTTKEWLLDFMSDQRNVERLKEYGKKIYDPKLGTYTMEQVSKILDINVSSVYHLVYNGYIRTIRRGTSHIVPEEELNKAKEYINLKKSAKNIA